MVPRRQIRNIYSLRRLFRSAYGDEWYGHWMYIPDSSSYGNSDIYTHHKETYGGAAAFGYKDFIPDFQKGIKQWHENNGAEEWAKLFEAAGAKYAVPVGIHSLYITYDTGWSDLNINWLRFS